LAGIEGLRLALIGPQAPPAGGMARQRDTLAVRLRQMGVAVEVVSVNPPHPAWVARVPWLRAALRLVRYGCALWPVLGRVEVAHVMACSGWSWHLFAAPAVWFARVRGVPVVMSYHGGQARAFFARQFKWLSPTFKHVRVLTTPSGFLQTLFAEYGLAAQVVPNSVDLSIFHPPANPRAAGLHVVVTRNLEPVYDIASALRAFARVLEKRPGATLTLAGSGPLLQALQQQARMLGVSGRVRFALRLDAAHMAALYREADVMLNPALADNFPNSVLEAAASAVPVVSTRVGGIPWLLQDEVSALLVEAGDDVAMAAAVMRIAEDTALRERLVREGRALAAAHDWQAVCRQWAAIYTGARGEAGASRGGDAD
jgi:glycosyltransferase involved in cell wall biosynthesis